jgi:hypothetical protein
LFSKSKLLKASFLSSGQEGTHINGARYRICTPEGHWNGDLVLYAQDYVRPAGELWPRVAQFFGGLVQ